MNRTRPMIALLLLALASGALSACGKKGPLEHPTSSTTATTGDDAKDEKEDNAPATGNTTP